MSDIPIIMNKHFRLLFIPISLSFFSCVYDPPREGKRIYIENQTENFIYFIDSLTGTNPRLYDTFLLNEKRHIRTTSGYIPKFDNRYHFVSKTKTDWLKKRGVANLTYYFIHDSNAVRSLSEISALKLYDSIQISLKDFEKNLITALIYDGYSIKLYHRYSLKHRKVNSE
jgi:hypothetical protein